MATEDVDALIEEVRALLPSKLRSQEPHVSQVSSGALDNAAVEHILRRGEEAIDSFNELQRRQSAKEADNHTQEVLEAMRHRARVLEFLSPEVKGGNDIHRAVATLNTRQLHEILYGFIEVKEKGDVHKASPERLSRTNAMEHTPFDIAELGIGFARQIGDERSVRTLTQMVERMQRYLLPKKEDAEVVGEAGKGRPRRPTRGKVPV
jgi:hypothetical protein